MQKHQKSSYTNYTQPVKSASHHQRRAKLANQQASDAARDQSKTAGSPPSQIHIIQRKGGRGGRENNREKTEISRDAEGASPHEKTQKNKHDVENREAERVNNPSKCANSLMDKQKQQDATHTHTKYI